MVPTADKIDWKILGTCNALPGGEDDVVSGYPTAGSVKHVKSDRQLGQSMIPAHGQIIATRLALFRIKTLWVESKVLWPSFVAAIAGWFTQLCHCSQSEYVQTSRATLQRVACWVAQKPVSILGENKTKKIPKHVLKALINVSTLNKSELHDPTCYQCLW